MKVSKKDFVSYKTDLNIRLFCNSRNLLSTLPFIFEMKLSNSHNYLKMHFKLLDNFEE